VGYNAVLDNTGLHSLV